VKIKPISLKFANAYVEKYHRHSKKSQGCKFCIAAIESNENILGIAIVR